MAPNKNESRHAARAFGCHLPLRGGYAHAARLAVQLQQEAGVRSYQFFSKNPRGLSIKSGYEADAQTAREICLEHGIQSIAHTPYPTNLAVDASRSPEKFQLTVQSLLNDLMIADACGAVGIVVHFGSYKGISSTPATDAEKLSCYENIIVTLNTVLSVWNGRAKLLIENQAGNHGGLGATLEELVSIRQFSQYPDKIGFCFDTCHAYASGLWNPSATNELLMAGNRHDFWKHVHAVHLNDSREPYRSKQDRHVNLGQGYIGIDGFTELLRAKELERSMFVLETPGDASGGHMQEWKLIQDILQ